MERLVYEEFEDVSDYKKEHGVGYCEDKPCPDEKCQPDPECTTGCQQNAAEVVECKYGLDHSATGDDQEDEWKLFNQVHLFTNYQSGSKI